MLSLFSITVHYYKFSQADAWSFEKQKYNSAWILITLPSYSDYRFFHINMKNIFWTENIKHTRKGKMFFNSYPQEIVSIYLKSLPSIQNTKNSECTIFLSIRFYFEKITNPAVPVVFVLFPFKYTGKVGSFTINKWSDKKTFTFDSIFKNRENKEMNE